MDFLLTYLVPADRREVYFPHPGRNYILSACREYLWACVVPKLIEDQRIFQCFFTSSLAFVLVL